MMSSKFSLCNMRCLRRVGSVTFIQKKQIRTFILDCAFRDKLGKSSLKEFPDTKRAWNKYCKIAERAQYCNHFLLVELMQECGINPSSLPLHGFEMQHLLTKDIEILKRVNLVSSVSELTERLLSHLEPFPFDFERGLPKYRGYENYMTIKRLKQIIEKQYLAWKFNEDLVKISLIYDRFQSCSPGSSSLKSMISTLNLMDTIVAIQNQNIINKIFITQIKPLAFEDLLNFEDTFVGMGWDYTAYMHPIFMKKSYPVIMLMVNILRDIGFRDSQIRVGLPLFLGNFWGFIKRLKLMMNDAELSAFKTDKNFLCMLCFSHITLGRFLEVGKTYDELSNYNYHYPLKRTSKYISYSLIRNSLFDGNILKDIKKHPKVFMHSLPHVDDTIKFLLKNNFTLEEIMESITIVLYPMYYATRVGISSGIIQYIEPGSHFSDHIKKALKRIKEEEETLRAIGFEDGCVNEKTKFFARGTKSRNKNLQLCLYFMEKEHNFSGEGVLK